MKMLSRLCLLGFATAAACSYDASQLAGPPTGGVDGAVAGIDGARTRDVGASSAIAIDAPGPTDGVGGTGGTVATGGTVTAGGGPGGGSPGGVGGTGGGGAGSGPQLDRDASVVSAGPDLGGAEPLPDLKGYQCDDFGSCPVCQPINILSLGQPASYGKNSGADSTDAFQDSLNSNTGGTATMVMLKTFKHFTDATVQLEKYKVIIMQALEDNEYTGLWSYTKDDAAALRDWVKNGGALITMTGYGGNTTEVDPLNQLLGKDADNWSGISYNADDTFNSCPNNMCYCAYSSVAFDGWQTSCTECAAITKNHDGTLLGKVGIFHGRSINCTGSDCQVFAKDSSYGNVGVAKIVGNGRVLAWASSWVTYTSQWGLTPDSKFDSTNSAQCNGYTPYSSYTVPQFWYNVFRWTAQTSCFTIDIPSTASNVQKIVP
jgi:hypothetical protein